MCISRYVRDLIAMWTPSERATYANVVTMVRSLGTNKKAMKHYAGDLAADLHAKGCPGSIAAAVAAKFKGANKHRVDSATTDQTGSESEAAECTKCGVRGHVAKWCGKVVQQRLSIGNTPTKPDVDPRSTKGRKSASFL